MSEPPKRTMSADTARTTLQVGGATIDLVRIPPGEFLFGSPPAETERRSSEVPVRRVHISRAFQLGRGPVTQKQWRAVMGEVPKQPPGDDLPVAEVRYVDALQFCQRLSSLTGSKARLPTEAEWEYACRAGTSTRYWSGDSEADLARVAWYRENAGGHVHAAGEKPANPFGVVDMHGNLWEYTSDYIQDFDSLAAVDPVGSRSDWQGAMRGGGFMNDADDCRCAARLVSDDMFGGVGLRILVEL